MPTVSLTRCTRAVLLVSTLLLFSGQAQAQQAIGLGIIVGEPTGLSAKTWLRDGGALAAAAAWSFKDEDALDLHLDYLRHVNISSPTERDGGRLRPRLHYGVGGRLKAESDTRLSVRFPVGITGHPRSVPVDVFVEVVPLLDLAPATEIDMSAAIGARYYF